MQSGTLCLRLLAVLSFGSTVPSAVAVGEPDSPSHWWIHHTHVEPDGTPVWVESESRWESRFSPAQMEKFFVNEKGGIIPGKEDDHKKALEELQQWRKAMRAQSKEAGEEFRKNKKATNGEAKAKGAQAKEEGEREAKTKKAEAKEVETKEAEAKGEGEGDAVASVLKGWVVVLLVLMVAAAAGGFLFWQRANKRPRALRGGLPN